MVPFHPSKTCPGGKPGESKFSYYEMEEEEKAFRGYIEELRAAKDRDEFDRFMNSRSGVVNNEQTQNTGETPNNNQNTF